PDNLIVPLDIVIETHDQHMFWFLNSLITSITYNKQTCFSNCKTHGFITNSAGKKFKGKNYIDPLDMIDGTVKISGDRQYGYGSDVLRIYFCQNDSDMDYKLFEEDLIKAKEQLKIIKKAFKQCLGFLDDYSVDK